jgi:hypothetical protein
MYPRIFFLFLGLTLVGTTWAWGQMGREFGPHHPGFHERLLEIKRRQLGPALGVDQRTVDRLLAIDQRYGPQRQQLIRQMKADWRRLQQLMGQTAPPEQEVKTVLDHMRHKRLEMLNLQRRQGDEEMAILTPIQQARYLMYLRTLIREARSIRSGGPPAGKFIRPGQPREIPVSRPPQ